MSRIRADKLVDRLGTGGPRFPNGVAEGFNVTGVITATSFSGSLAASNLTGTIDDARLSGTYNITASNAQGLTGSPNITITNVSAQDVQVGGALTVTGNLTVNGTTTTIDTVLTEVDKLEVSANNSTVGVAITQTGAGDILRLYDSSTQVFTVIDGGNVGINSTVPRGTLDIQGRVHFNGGLIEKFENAGTTLGSQTNNPLADGNVILFTGNETGNLTINFTGVHSTLRVGENVSFTAIITPNNSGVINALQIDSAAQTIRWSGGSAPSASASGQDVYTFTILKTGTGTTNYQVFGAATNYAS